MAKTILLADDSPTIRKIVELTFGGSEIRVDAVGTGAEAMKQFEAERPDLVLADVVMPEPAGYEICRAVKNSSHPVPVLLLAGAFEPYDVERGRECGADDHLVKPFESRVLIEKVERLLNPPEVIEPPDEPAEELDEEIDALAEEVQESAPTDSEEPARSDEAIDVAVRAVGAVDPLSPEDIQAIARAVVSQLSRDVIREIVRDVVPELAAKLIRERIRELEGEE